MVGNGTLTLDTLISSSIYFAAKWTPELKRNQSRDVLRLIVNKLFGASHGSLFNSSVRCSHSAIADSLDLSREWTSKLISRLRQTGWLKTHAPRLPNGTQEVTIFSPGGMLKKLLIMLLRSKQRPQSRVNNSSQHFPTKEEVEKNLSFLAELRASLAEKFAFKETKR